MRRDTYTCERCHGTFEKGWSDEEAVAEAKELDLLVPGDEVAMLCDDCHRDFMAWWLRRQN